MGSPWLVVLPLGRARDSSLMGKIRAQVLVEVLL